MAFWYPSYVYGRESIVLQRIYCGVSDKLGGDFRYEMGYVFLVAVLIPKWFFHRNIRNQIAYCFFVIIIVNY